MKIEQAIRNDQREPGRGESPEGAPQARSLSPMKLQAAMKYYFSEYSLTVSIFYLVIVLLYGTFTILALAFPGVGISANGMDYSAVVFLFVVGLNSFKGEFRFFLQNGISRRTLLASFHLSAVLLSVGTVAISLLLSLLFGRMMQTDSMSIQLYGISGLNPLGLLHSVLTSLLMLEMGFLVTTLFYRMNKAMKLVFSIGVPVLLFIVLPASASLLPGLWRALANLIGWYLGKLPDYASPTVQVLRASANLLLTSVLCALGSWLLVRKATLKND